MSTFLQVLGFVDAMVITGVAVVRAVCIVIVLKTALNQAHALQVRAAEQEIDQINRNVQRHLITEALRWTRGRLVREGGLEPPRPKAQDPKSCASANSATPAHRSPSVRHRPRGSVDPQVAPELRHVTGGTHVVEGVLDHALLVDHEG